MSRTVICLGPVLPQASSVLPGTWRAAISFLHGLASDGVYNAVPVTGPPVVSYTAVSPLPRLRGGILSVALSLGSLPPAVNRHPAL